MPGSLFLVATPIGNLEDITLRALRVLREADLIAAEDTRRTGNLLAHFGISTPTTSLHAHNEARRVPDLIAQVADGLTLAVVTDAGMPGVSDPGYLVVRHALDAGVSVQVIPGVSALTTALAGSGLPIEAFVFLGFAPSRGAERKRWIAANLELEHRTAVMFEAPGRLSALLADLHEILGDRQVVVARELTKVHESWRRGWLSDVSAFADVPARGECVVLVYDQNKRPLEDDEEPAEDRVLDLYRRLADTPGLTRKGVIQQVAAALSVPSKRVYAIIERAKVSIE